MADGIALHILDTVLCIDRLGPLVIDPRRASGLEKNGRSCPFCALVDQGCPLFGHVNHAKAAALSSFMVPTLKDQRIQISGTVIINDADDRETEIRQAVTIDISQNPGAIRGLLQNEFAHMASEAAGDAQIDGR